MQNVFEYDDTCGNTVVEHYMDGKRHRLFGPAVVITGKNGEECYVEYWICGKELNTHEVKKWLANEQIDLSTEEGQLEFYKQFS